MKQKSYYIAAALVLACTHYLAFNAKRPNPPTAPPDAVESGDAQSQPAPRRSAPLRRNRESDTEKRNPFRLANPQTANQSTRVERLPPVRPRVTVSFNGEPPMNYQPESDEAPREKGPASPRLLARFQGALQAAFPRATEFLSRR